MKRKDEFPFERARRVTAEEVEAARLGIQRKLGIKLPARGRPPKDDDEKYTPVSIRLHPQVLKWARAEGRRRRIGYQTVINETLLKASSRAVPATGRGPVSR